MTPCTHPHCPHPAAWLHDGAAVCRRHAIDGLIRTGRPATVLPAPPPDIVDRLAASGDALAAEAAAEIRRLRATLEAGQ